MNLFDLSWAVIDLVPTWQDLDVLDSIIVVLKCLRGFIDMRAGEKGYVYNSISGYTTALSHQGKNFGL